jgi:GTP-binding protein HflX
LIRKRIQELKKKLKKIELARERQAENRSDIFHVGIVGYTNAGKSTLINRLTKADVYVENKLFATLDSTTRQLYIGNGESIILSDTVGFIRKLPHHLVETFKSTLGVAAHANCILEVVDSSAVDYEEHMEVTHRVLDNIIDGKIPRIRVFNKAEMIDDSKRRELLEKYPNVLQVSAKENIGMEALKKLLIEKKDLWQKEREVQKEMELNAPDGWVTENLIDETGM